MKLFWFLHKKLVIILTFCRFFVASGIIFKYCCSFPTLISWMAAFGLLPGQWKLKKATKSNSIISILISIIDKIQSDHIIYISKPTICRTHNLIMKAKPAVHSLLYYISKTDIIILLPDGFLQYFFLGNKENAFETYSICSIDRSPYSRASSHFSRWIHASIA